MKITTGAIIILAVIAAFAILKWVDGCRDKPDPGRQQYIDSTRAANRYTDSIYAASIFRLNADVAVYKAKSDSSDKAKGIAEKALEVSKAKGLLLTAKLEQSRGDTAAFMKNCDSLSRHIVTLTEDVARFQNATEDLTRQNKELVGKYDIAVKERDRFNASLRAARDSITNFSQVVVTNPPKEKIKRWGIGPSAGVTYRDGRIEPVAGFTIQYNLIRL